MKSYKELREVIDKKDRGLREKVMSLTEAIGLIQDGDHVASGGCHYSRTPMAAVWEIIRQKKKDLIYSRSITSTEGDLLLVAGATQHVITSWFSPGVTWGVSRVMRHYTREEAGRLRGVEPHVARAALSGRRHGHSLHPGQVHDGLGPVPRLPEFKEMDCPYTGEKLALVPALNPDVAILHTQRCDPYGNVQSDGLPFMDQDIAMAADKVIVTTERIISNDQVRREPGPDQNSLLLRGCRGGSSLRLPAPRVLRRLRAGLREHGCLCQADDGQRARGSPGVPGQVRLRAGDLERLSGDDGVQEHPAGDRSRGGGSTMTKPELQYRRTGRHYERPLPRGREDRLRGSRHAADLLHSGAEDARPAPDHPFRRRGHRTARGGRQNAALDQRAAGARRANMLLSITDVLLLQQRGYVDYGFLGGAQIDQYGNLNSSFIGDPDNPKVRLPGTGGANDIASLASKILVAMHHEKKALCQEGGLHHHPRIPARAATAAKKAGLIVGGIYKVITHLGIFGFDEKTRRMRLETLHPGVTVEEVKERTGFEMLIPEKIRLHQAPHGPRSCGVSGSSIRINGIRSRGKGKKTDGVKGSFNSGPDYGLFGIFEFLINAEILFESYGLREEFFFLKRRMNVHSPWQDFAPYPTCSISISPFTKGKV